MARRRPILLTGTLVLAALVASACGGGTDEVQTQQGNSTSSAAPSKSESTPAEAPDRWPLRGNEAGDGDIEQPAVVVKIDNDPHARPQSGLNQADIVYEIEVEGITRFAAMFHSTTVDQVGPIRSARSSDIDVIAALGTPLFAWSGANGGVTGEVNAAQDAGLLVNVGQDAAMDEYWRDTTRYAPYNLYSSISGLRALDRPAAGSPSGLFAYRDGDDELPASAVPSSGIAVGYVGDGRISNVEFVWDPDRGGWARFQTDNLHGDGSPHVDAAGEQIAPENVVVLYTNYSASLADSRSPQAQTLGEGDALVLTGEGQAITGRWSRGANTDGVTLTDAEGDEIALTAGRTWVLLPQPGHVGPMPPDRAGYLLTLN